MENHEEKLSGVAVEDDGGLDDLELVIDGERFHNNAATEDEAEKVIACLGEMYPGVSFSVKKFSIYFGPIDLPNAGNHQWERAEGYSIWFSPLSSLGG